MGADLCSCWSIYENTDTGPIILETRLPSFSASRGEGSLMEHWALATPVHVFLCQAKWQPCSQVTLYGANGHIQKTAPVVKGHWKSSGVRNCLTTWRWEARLVGQAGVRGTRPGPRGPQVGHGLFAARLSGCRLTPRTSSSARGISLKSLFSPTFYVHLWHCSSMICLICSLPGISLALLPVFRVLTHI